MHPSAALTLLLYPLPLALALAVPADKTPSPNEITCKPKSTSTGSGAFEAIKGFCHQLEIPSSDLATNGYVAGGFRPSGQTTSVGISTLGCGEKVPDMEVEECEKAFWGVCAGGDELGKGKGGSGCLGLRVE